jgi:lipopolysaccharide biosynthesis glycosyltransferase
MVFVHLLRDLGIRHDADVILLHLPLRARTTEKIKRMGITSRLVETVQTVKYWGFRHCLVKLRVLELAEYERVVYIDADAIPLKNLDYLFSLPITGPVAAPRAYWLQQPYWTSALFVAHPSITSWNRVKPHFAAASQRDYFDMEIINCEFANEIQSLPATVFCLNSEWEEANRLGFFSDPVEAYSSVSVVHFTALGKPWTYSTAEARRLRPNAHPIFYDLWDKWRTTRELIFR